MSNAALDPEVTPEIVARHGLTPKEFIRIKKILGREPNFTELGIFSVMWSEHCSYKNSRRELRNSPRPAQTFWLRQAKKMPAWLISAMVGRWRLRSNHTIIRARSSRSKGRPPELAESFATFSRWARARNFA